MTFHEALVWTLCSALWLQGCATSPSGGTAGTGGSSARIVLIEPLPNPVREPVPLPAAVSQALGATRYASWACWAAEKVHFAGGALGYRLILHDGSSTRPSQDAWRGLLLDAGGGLLAEWDETPRVGPLESQ